MNRTSPALRLSVATSLAIAGGTWVGISPSPAREVTTAPALDPGALLGRWLAESGGERVASIDFSQGADGLSYVRRSLLEEGGTERGRGQVRGAYLYTLESQAVNGLSDHFAAPMTLEGRHRAMYRASREGAQKLTGRVIGPSSRGPASNLETLRRSQDDNRVDLLIDGPQAFPSIDAAILGARESICLQTFSWFDDSHGFHIADLLAQKVREGVKVRCLVEAFPQKGGVGWKVGKRLRAGGVDLIIHHTISEGIKNSIGNFWKKIGRFFTGKKKEPQENRGLFSHDHRKLIVVDGRVAFTGGMNIGDKYLLGTTWHDVHCRVEGSAVPPMEALFFDRWRAAGGKGEALARSVRGPGPGNLPVEVLENLPGVRLDVTRRYMAEFDAARSEILIGNPYMLYDPVVVALKRKASQGVRVVAILPSNDLNDEAFARDAFLWVQNDVVRSGVELYKYRERMSHGKVAVFDGRLATIGTTNLDQMAMERNAELNLFISDRGFARTVAQRVIMTDLPNSDRVKVEELGWWKKVLAGTMHSIRSFL